MERIGFYIFYGINWLITLLPLRILYLFSDILFLVLYYFPSYRRKIVADNLRKSFPEKSDLEIKKITKKFYRHFSDLFIETLKLTHLSNKELKKRMVVRNADLLDKFYDTGRDISAVYSHFNNWEWVGAVFSLFTRYKTVAVYKPMQNIFFDRFINNLRTKNGAGIIPMDKIARKIIENRSMNIRTLYGFLADQTPAKIYIQHYTDFLNQETPVFLGVEKLAKKYDMPVVFINVRKLKRGYYDLTIELLFESTAGLPEFCVTEKHVKRLEELIRENPEYWVWTHRRWKYKKSDLDG